MRSFLFLAGIAWLACCGVAFGYSVVPTSAQELAPSAECLVDGVVQSSQAKLIGAAIVTDHTIAIARSAGQCSGATAALIVRTPGGTLPNGMRSDVLGLLSPSVGVRYFFLLETSALGIDQGEAVHRIVGGGQGALEIRATQSGESAISDLIGSPYLFSSARAGDQMQTIFIKQSGAVAYPTLDPQAISNHGANFKSGDVDLLFRSLQAIVTDPNHHDKSVQRQVMRRKLNMRTGPGESPSGAIGQPEALPGLPIPIQRRVDCLSAPAKSGAASKVCEQLGPERNAPVHSLISSGGARPWNVPSNLGDYGTRVENMMAEWNRYADRFRVFTVRENAYGINDRNDIGGFPTSAQMAPIYGEGWPLNVLGYTFTRTHICLETTTEYFLGIPIRTYCSRYSDTESDIFLNPDITWSYEDDAVRSGRVSSQSILEVMSHEVGHGFGLGHSSQPALMNAAVSKRVGFNGPMTLTVLVHLGLAMQDMAKTCASAWLAHFRRPMPTAGIASNSPTKLIHIHFSI